MPQSILRLSTVKVRTGCSRSTIYLRISQGLWPRPVRLGARSVGWPESEVDALIRARIAGKADDLIRQLVLQLVTARGEVVR
jgi:prophage regulatory protein